MEPKLKKLFEKAQEVSMTPIERVALAERIRALPRATRSPYSFFTIRLIHQGVAAVLIMSLAGVGTAFAASAALPGDVLFPVKINVNERVESLLAVTSQAQAQIAIEQATRRLDEAEELIQKGRLTEEVTREIEDNFTQRAEVVKARVQKLRDERKGERADEAEKKFDERIDSHLESFVKFEDGEGSTTPGVREVRGALERHRESRKNRDTDKQGRKEEIRSSDSSKTDDDSNDSDRSDD